MTRTTKQTALYALTDGKEIYAVRKMDYDDYCAVRRDAANASGGNINWERVQPNKKEQAMKHTTKQTAKPKGAAKAPRVTDEELTLIEEAYDRIGQGYGFLGTIRTGSIMQASRKFRTAVELLKSEGADTMVILLFVNSIAGRHTADQMDGSDRKNWESSMRHAMRMERPDWQARFLASYDKDELKVYGQEAARVDALIAQARKEASR